MVQENKVNISEDNTGDILILRLHGRLDVFSTPDIEKKIADHVRGGQRKLLLNFNDVTYMSSAGIKMLLALTVKLRLVSGKLVLCSPSSIVQHILKASGFFNVIEIVDTESDAKNKFQSII